MGDSEAWITAGTPQKKKRQLLYVATVFHVHDEVNTAL